MRAVLDALGMSSRYVGYKLLMKSLQIAVDDEDAVSRITKCIYMPVAEMYGMTVQQVEKNIRSVIDAFWSQGNRGLYGRIVGYEVKCKPKNAEFISAVSSYLIRRRERNDKL